MKIAFKALPAKHFADLPLGTTFRKDSNDHINLYMKVTTNRVQEAYPMNTVILNVGSLIYTSSIQEVIPVEGTWSQEI